MIKRVIFFLTIFIVGCEDTSSANKECSVELKQKKEPPITGYFSRCDLQLYIDSVVLDNQSYRLNNLMRLPWNYVVTDKFFIYHGSTSVIFMNKINKQKEFEVNIKGLITKIIQMNGLLICESSKGLTVVNINSRNYIEDLVQKSPFVCYEINYRINQDSTILIRNNTDLVWRKFDLP